MNAGEPVYAVGAFPGASNLVAMGCDSGKLLVMDVETEKEVYSCENADSIIVVQVADENTVYGATEEQISVFDMREGRPAKVVLKAPSEIYDFSVAKDRIAVATLSHDIITSDKRVFRKAQSSGILPSVCTSLALTDDGIVAGYLDTVIGKWSLSDGKFCAFGAAKPQQFNPPVIHSVDAFNEWAVAGRQTSLSIYKSGKLIADEMFEHDGAIQAVAIAKCFGDRPFCASGAADGSLMIFDLEKMKSLDCLTIEGEKIQCITSNKKFIAVADTSDEGNIGVFTEDDFGGEEEEEEEKAEK